MWNYKNIFLWATLIYLIFSSEANAIKTNNLKDKLQLNTSIAQNTYRDRIWPSIQNHVPQPGDRKTLTCSFSKQRNLDPLNSLMTELYRDSFGDGAAEVADEMLSKNSHDYTLEFQMQALNSDVVRIRVLDTVDGKIAHSYIVDFQGDETLDVVDFGDQPNTPEGKEEVLQVYKKFMPNVLKQKCMDYYQYSES